MILENLKDYKIVLASKSPRRRQLLEKLGVGFNVTSVNIEEKYPDKLNPEDIAIYLAKLKANHYSINTENEKILLITADTVVTIDNSILGKPSDEKEAIKILNRLSGNYHDVITGVCIKTINNFKSFSVKTRVHFKNLRANEINYYVREYKPYDKAGSYGIQEWIGYIGIDYIAGSFYNVMGLPVQRLYEELLKF